jgi:hypothetical protein
MMRLDTEGFPSGFPDFFGTAETRGRAGTPGVRREVGDREVRENEKVQI